MWPMLFSYVWHIECFVCVLILLFKKYCVVINPQLRFATPLKSRPKWGGALGGSQKKKGETGKQEKKKEKRKGKEREGKRQEERVEWGIEILHSFFFVFLSRWLFHLLFFILFDILSLWDNFQYILFINKYIGGKLWNLKIL